MTPNSPQPALLSGFSKVRGEEMSVLLTQTAVHPTQIHAFSCKRVRAEGGLFTPFLSLPSDQEHDMETHFLCAEIPACFVPFDRGERYTNK